MIFSGSTLFIYPFIQKCLLKLKNIKWQVVECSPCINKPTGVTAIHKARTPVGKK